MNNFDDVEPVGIPIDLADDDFETDGFVKVGCAVKAIAKFMMSKGANKFQAERDAWPHIYTGIRRGVLHPVSPQTLRPLSVEDYGNGMILFSELVTWGQTTKLFTFRKAANAVGNGSGAPKVGGGETAEDSPAIPGKLSPVAIGKLAITAAWQIECETKRRASAKEVMTRLQAWANAGKEPAVLTQSLPAKRAVQWLTTKGKHVEYTIEACQETLNKWNKSRQ